MSADDIDLDQLLLIAKESRRNHLTDAGLQTLVTRLQELHDQYEVLPKKEAQELRTLREPIFTFGVYLEPGPDDERDLIVGTEGQRIIVRLSEEIEQRRADLKQGQEVVLNNQKNIVSIHDIAVPGELAEVVNVIKPDNAGKVMMIYEEEAPPALVVLWRNDQEIRVRINESAMQPTRSYLHRGSFVQLDEAAEQAVAVVRPKLHVRTGGGEGTIIEISEQLMLDDVQIGNMVRFEPTYRFAFEKIASNATSKLTLSAPPDTTYEDIGGLDEQIAIIHSAIELPYIYRAQYREYNMARPKGILLYGPPGCGKTMIARAIANSLTTTIREHLEEKRQRLDLFIKLRAAPQDQALLQRYATLAHMPVAQIMATDALARLQEWLAQFDVDVALAQDALLEVNRQLSKELRPFFMNIKGPELLSKWVGETERQIREIFEEARSKSSFETPVVIFFDEMESLFRTRGSGRSSDVETTIVPQFLAEIDGVETTQNVIIIGASNRPDMVDPAFLRPGRFDRKIRVDRPNEEAARDIMAKSLVSTLPLNPRGLSSTHGAVGKVVFRSGYKKYQKTPFLDELMKISVDIRLLQNLDAEDIRILTPYAELTVSQTRTQIKAHEELVNKLQRFRGITVVRDILRVHADFERLMQDAQWQQFIKTCIRKEWIAEKLILETIRYLYADSSELSVLMVDGRISFKVREFMNGATLDSIVMRAKSAALRRSVDGMAVTNGIISNDIREEVGITKDDLVRAIREELNENKEQLAQYKVQNELKKTSDSIQTVDVLLEEVIGENPWFEQKLRPYQPETRA